MKRKRSCLEGDNQVARLRVKQQTRQRPFSSVQLSSPPLEPVLHVNSASEHSPQLLPLTQDNLRRLERSARTPSPAMGRSPSRAQSRSPDKSSIGTDKLEPKEKLQLYGVFYDDMNPIPDALNSHISDNLLKIRDASSPNAKLIASKAPGARSLSEQDGIDALRNKLFFESASDGGEPFVRVAAKVNLSTAFLPPAADLFARYNVFEQPQPDHAIGYIPSKIARPLYLAAPFSQHEENILNSYALTNELYFPFFTVQWKSPKKSQTHEQAIPQGARDGSTIVNYLHQFYTKARPGVEPSMVETCHFSATVDMRSVVLWVHWRDKDSDGNVSFYMEQVDSGMLDKERDNKQIRTFLRNLQDYALSKRLESIRQALPPFREQLMRQKATPAPTVTVASSASEIGNVPPLPPPTPSSSSSEPSRKRPRTGTDIDPNAMSRELSSPPRAVLPSKK